MANQEHLDILRRGIDVWNDWRKENPYILPDLSEIALAHANLRQADFRSACLLHTDLSGADLSDSDIRGAYLSTAHLASAKLRRANLSDTNFHNSNLRNVDFCTTNLRRARFSSADLDGADFSRSLMHLTIFVDVDLSRVKGLNIVRHEGPSSIGIDTISRSQGQIPENFFRGAGVPDLMIDYARYFIGNPVQYQTCFISYSNQDQKFAEKLYFDLQSNAVRCWFAPEDMKIGDKLRPKIDESIHFHDKLLLVLSEHSVASQWVEQEVETALARERKENRTILFPIRLDKTVLGTEFGWPALIRNTRNIGNFENWKRHENYYKAFSLLLRDLKVSQ